MTSLVRWDPFRDMAMLQNEMNRLFEETFRTLGVWAQNGDSSWAPALDVRETDDAFIVEASIPGINPDNLNINLLNNMLTIEGEVQPEEQEAKFHLRERPYGRFYRSIQLPTPVNSEQIEASYTNGVLRLHVPKAEEAKPKRIAVRSNGHLIEAQPA